MNVFGVAFPDPLTSVGRLARGLGGVALTSLEQLAGGRERRAVWSCPGRVYVEAHGVHGPDGAPVAKRIERALAKQPGVRWARVNAPTSRVIIAVEDPPPRKASLVSVVARAETEPDDEEKIVEDELHHPADGTTGTRLKTTVAVDALGMMLALVNKIAPWAPLPAEAAGVLSALNAHPDVRRLVGERLGGHEKADSVLSMTTALVHGLAARGEGTFLDIATRAAQWWEARAHERAWCRAEAGLVTGPEHAEAEAVVTERPRELPDGDVERYARRALAVGAGVAVAATPFAGPRRAIGAGLAALPKAPETGRSAFAAQLGRVMARRGVLVMDRVVLRRLDLVDVLVLDTEALVTGRWQLTDLVPLPGSDPAELAPVVFRLFDPVEPKVVHRDGEWAIGPVDELDLTGRKGSREQEKLSGLVLGLARGRRLEAVVAAGEETAPGLHALTTAARQANLRVVEHTEGSPVAAVRSLQADGHVVMLLSGDRRALGAADCGIGTHRDGTPPPWGAHLLIGADLDGAVLAVEAAGAARRVNRDTTMLAKAASGIGAVNALNSPFRSASRGMRAVNTGAALAFVDGTWRAGRLLGSSAGDAPSAGARTPWHLMPVELVLDRLGSGPDGLTDAEARRRPATGDGDGSRGTSFGRAFLAELANPLTPVLAGGAALSAAVGSPVDAALVGAIVSVSAVIGGLQQTHTERALASLLKRSAVRATVRRGGEERRVTAGELVVGDVVVIDSGDVVPADCRLMSGPPPSGLTSTEVPVRGTSPGASARRREDGGSRPANAERRRGNPTLAGAGVEVDESSVTGESLPVAKDPGPVVAAEIADRTSMLYEGTTIATGTAVAVVVAIGDETEVGRGMAAARADAPTTGVEARLASLTRKSLPLALGSAAAVTGAGLLHGVPLRETLGAAVNLAVASVPEGLPFLVNAAQLAAARRLADHNALVRNPRTIEALGRVDVLCFDKTGTLTEGTLSLSQVDDGRDAAGIDSLGDTQRRVLAAAVRATPDADRPEELAHQTDRAVVEGARRARVGQGNGWRLVDSVPFEPSRGYHATVGQSGDQAVLSVKGAPEVVVPRCGRHRVDGTDRPIDGAARRRLKRRMEKLAASGHRVLAVAERPVSTVEATEDAVDDLCLLGFVALSDPVRESAPPAAAKLREAGVQIVMITGDHPATGEAVAGRVNGGGGELTVLTGAEITSLDDDELSSVLPSVNVIARCSPAQKVRIIQAYQRLGKVVAMTGDGANDAPAIRLADVGIALGRRGTPAARAAADLVVTDDRLETIIAALVEGRAMWASVREALGILLGGNVGEIAFTVFGSALSGRSPLTARQLLLVNLLTDLAPALAIALSQPSRRSVDELLREGPGTSLGTALTKDISLRAITTTAGATAAWLAARFTGRARRASTVALASLVGTQLAQTLAAGGRDRTVLAAGLGSALLLAVVIQTPGLSQFFGCTPLGPVGWTIALGSATTTTLLSTLLAP
ncbi:cation-transporting P-type ATPase [Actinophytocola sp.]|uniref:cation-translocating P-type ATPase n=1 Tax=Actinophytocola sp. TaxID=1872138 RepID=UPI002ED0BB74